MEQTDELAKDPEVISGGVLTPASGCGMTLVQRLRDNAGMTFEINETRP